MKRLISVSVMLAVLIGTAIAAAEPMTLLMLTDSQIAELRSNCTSIQSSLNRVHENDALARVKLGREYETVSTRLMASMNNRVLLGKLDGVALTQTTVDFNAEFEHFRGAQGLYQDYEKTMSAALDINCNNQPVEFFDTVTRARTKREAVKTSIDRLNQLMAQYTSQVGAVQSAAATNQTGATR